MNLTRRSPEEFFGWYPQCCNYADVKYLPCVLNEAAGNTQVRQSPTPLEPRTADRSTKPHAILGEPPETQLVVGSPYIYIYRYIYIYIYTALYRPSLDDLRKNVFQKSPAPDGEALCKNQEFFVLLALDSKTEL